MKNYKTDMLCFYIITVIQTYTVDNPYKDEFQILTSIKKSIVQIFLSPKLLTPKRLKQDLNVGYKCGVNVVVLRTLNFSKS